MTSPVSVLNFPKTAVTNSPLNLASTNSLFTKKTTFSSGIYNLDNALNVDDAFAIYIPALTPFPDTSAKEK